MTFSAIVNKQGQTVHKLQIANVWDRYIYIYIPLSHIYIERGLQGSEANSLGQTDRLTEWFLLLHFAAKNGREGDEKQRGRTINLQK